ncbi:hypothetical protein AK812_SmicGene648 [Symbiodinium microadriaticum]|uniref:Uncharacterized protein n=1 Tax=Symbiodinium microadriaticum TaxID=2951 RepID=A0A1Q9F663_SYMMI|nr:hypothetical protein AK812_SmicGene648 [Symbiodinium microadriaticum]
MRSGLPGPGTISVMTWNVVNNNPFEYWLEYDDSSYFVGSYTELMVGVENILAHPGDVDIAVSEIFTEAMFQELKALMRQQGMPGVDEVEAVIQHYEYNINLDIVRAHGEGS